LFFDYFILLGRQFITEDHVEPLKVTNIFFLFKFFFIFGITESNFRKRRMPMR